MLDQKAPLYGVLSSYKANKAYLPITTNRDCGVRVRLFLSKSSIKLKYFSHFEIDAFIKTSLEIVKFN